jgi:acyl carrier protein
MEQVGIDDDFFEAGGHSLLATRLVSRMNHAFDVNLPLVQIFELRSIRQLAPIIEATKSSSTGRAAPIVRATRHAVSVPVNIGFEE